IVAGAQIEEDSAWQEAIAFAEHLDADVYQQPIPPRWTFPRRHSLFRGGLLPAQQPLAEQLADYDVVVVLGAPIFLYYAYVPGDVVKPGTKLFQLTNSSPDAAAALGGTSVVGNLTDGVRYLRTHTKARTARTRKPHSAPAQPFAESPMTPAHLFHVLNRVMPRD